MNPSTESPEITDINGRTVMMPVHWKLRGEQEEAKPGQKVIHTMTWLLVALAAGLLFVSFAAQFQYIFAVKHQDAPAMIEALSPDLAMIILSGLGIGLALAGKSSKAERVLIVACAFLAAGMNYAAADTNSPRSVAAYIAPPLLLAVITDRVISVIRRHVLPDDTESAWTWLGRAVLAASKVCVLVMLYGLRTALAPWETFRGLRQTVLNAAPVPGMIEVQAVPAIEADDDDPIVPPTKKDRFLALYRAHRDYGDRSKAGQVAQQLAPFADLQPGTGRTYIYEEIDRNRAVAS
jgi:hypothetical protein